MKLLFLTFILLISPLAHAEDFFHQRDKQLHMSVSAIGANSIRALGYTEIQAFWMMMTIGVVKEIADGHNNTMTEHSRDLLADAIGSATVVVWRIKW